jgi:hypothetical protein
MGRIVALFAIWWPAGGINLITCGPMLKKLFLALFIFLLCAGNAGLSQIGRYSMTLVSTWDSRFTNSFAKTWPLNDAEEKSGKSAASEGESVEDDEYLTLKWASLRLSGSSDISGNEAEILFKSIDREIVVPPPRA